MNDKDERYLTPPLATLWHWPDEGDVVHWAVGLDRLFVLQLCAVLPVNTSGGTLPNLTAILFALEACSDAEDLAISDQRLECLIRGAGLQTKATSIDSLRVGLQKIRQLPDKCRCDVDAQARLLQLLSSEVGAAARLPVSPQFQDRLMAAGDRAAKLPNPTRLSHETKASCRAAILALQAFGRAVITAERLHSLSKMGIDSIPIEVPSEVDIPDQPLDNYRSWLRQLRDCNDEDLRLAAHFALDASGVLALPRPVSDPDNLPAGGVSDIANRGSPERLLMTELAQDDLVLMTRIAMGQALYMRREAPPDRTPLHRLVLLESGVRVWGQSRLLVTAIGLASHATGFDHGVATHCFAAHGDTILPLDLGNRAGITAQLERLTLDPHPGAALGAFQQAMECQATTCEPLLIVAHDTSLDADFRRATMMLGASLLVADVQPTGVFHLSRWTKAGSEILQSGKLESTLRKSIIKPLVRTIGDLPLFLRTTPPPLRTSNANQPADVFSLNEFDFMVTRTGRLLRWELSRAGAIELDSKLPSYQVRLWHHRLADQHFGEELWAVLGNDARGFNLMRLDIARGTHYFVKLEGISLPVIGFFVTVDGYLVVVQQNNVLRLSVDTGERVGSPLVLKGLIWAGANFFKLGGHWGCVEYDQDALHFRKLEFPGTAAQLKINAVVPNSILGPVALSDGKVFGLDSTQASYSMVGADLLVGQWRIERISADRRRIMLTKADDKRFPLNPFGLRECTSATIDWDNREVSVASESKCYALLEKQAALWQSGPGLRHRFNAIGIHGYCLGLRGRKGKWDTIAHGGQTGCQLAKTTWPRDIEGNRTFIPETAGTYGFSLARCQWPDGRAAWLDGRGMLHIRDPQQETEVTFVLGEKEISGWMSDGILWGTKYFTGMSDLNQVPSEVWAWLKKFVR